MSQLLSKINILVRRVLHTKILTPYQPSNAIHFTGGGIQSHAHIDHIYTIASSIQLSVENVTLLFLASYPGRKISCQAKRFHHLCSPSVSWKFRYSQDQSLRNLQFLSQPGKRFKSVTFTRLEKVKLQTGMMNMHLKPSKWARNEKWIARAIVKYIAPRAKRYHEHWGAYGNGRFEVG